MLNHLRSRLPLVAICLSTALLLFGLRSYTSFSVDPSSIYWSSGSQLSETHTIQKDRPLITYVYSESPESRRNLEFFLAHGLHAQADFVFIFNGDTDADSLLPVAPEIRAVRRNNTCYDLGSHAEVLTTDDLWRRYSRFILMNASVRGPFMPTWADKMCWTDRLLSKLTSEVKLVGTSINCWPTPHVQSMVWATDRAGLSLLLHPPPTTSPRHDPWMETLFTHAADFPRPANYTPNDPAWVERGLAQCFASRQAAVEGEIAATGIVLGAGKRVDVLLTKYQTTAPSAQRHDAEAFCAPLGAWDPQGEGAYDGASVHPFESIFVKTNRGISPRLVENLSGWFDEMGYSSYDQCSAPAAG